MIRQILEDKDVLPKRAWSPSFDFRFTAREDFAKKIINTVIADVSILEHRRNEIGTSVNLLQDEVRRKRKELEDTEKRLEAVKSSFSVEGKQQEIDRIMSNLLIQGYEFRDPAVTIFTTEFLRKENIILGVFRIWIDWSKRNASEALAIINVYKGAGHNDHPCLSNGRLCLGNFSTPLEAAYKEKNLFVLLETVMAFLAQENPPSGYYHSWAEWNRSTAKRDKNFDFSSYGIRPGDVDRRVQERLMQQTWYQHANIQAYEGAATTAPQRVTSFTYTTSYGSDDDSNVPF
jgi:hypothetical protein